MGEELIQLEIINPEGEEACTMGAGDLVDEVLVITSLLLQVYGNIQPHKDPQPRHPLSLPFLQKNDPRQHV